MDTPVLIIHQKLQFISFIRTLYGLSQSEMTDIDGKRKSVLSIYFDDDDDDDKFVYI